MNKSMLDIIPNKVCIFRVPRPHHEWSKKMMKLGVDKIREQYSRCSDLTHEEFENLMSTEEWMSIICDDDLNLVSFLFCTRKETLTTLCPCIYGDPKYTNDLIGGLKFTSGYSRGNYDTTLTVYLDSDEERIKTFIESGFNIVEDHDVLPYRLTTVVRIFNKGKFD